MKLTDTQDALIRAKMNELELNSREHTHLKLCLFREELLQPLPTDSVELKWFIKGLKDTKQ